MANFKGFKQVSLETYLATSEQEKKNYLWFVRDLSGDTVLSAHRNPNYSDKNNKHNRNLQCALKQRRILRP